MTKYIKIIKCSDSLYWYAKYINYCVPYVGEEKDIYWSVEPGGYKNLVSKNDAVIVGVSEL